MENFIVSARKYRPSTFDMVVGQDSITNTLKSAIKNRLLSQAYLFCGPRGVGKTTCARIFAKTINCSDLKENGEACDKCESCISFNSMRSFNIHELDAASNNSVTDIRNLTDQVRIPPQVGKYSVYIVDEVHMLSSSAFNAFLKTLEEPPPHAVFILATTEKHKIIPTILSRCQIFDFNRIRIEDIVNRLAYVAKKEGVSPEEEALHIIAQKADGALRDALSIFDQIVSLSGKTITYRDVIENLNVLDYEYYFKCVSSALKGDISSILLIFNEILQKGFDGHNFISGLNSHLRDLLVSKDEATVKLLEATPSVKQRYLQQAASSPVEFIIKALETGNSCDLSYKSSKNQRLHVELTLIRLCMIMGDIEGESEKKKSFAKLNESAEEVLSPPARSEIIRDSDESPHTPYQTTEEAVVKHFPTVVKPVKSFSVKDILSSAEGKTSDTTPEPDEEQKKSDEPILKKMLTNELFEQAWSDFTVQLNGEGARIVSMFKTIRPEFEDGKTIRIHLTNAAQKDLFVQNYKSRLIGFLDALFETDDIDIETVVDLTQSNDILYTDEQKYNFLVSKYPNLKEFRKAFNLDIL